MTHSDHPDPPPRSPAVYTQQWNPPYTLTFFSENQNWPSPPTPPPSSQQSTPKTETTLTPVVWQLTKVLYFIAS